MRGAKTRIHGAASRGRGLVSESGWLGLRAVRWEGGGGGEACEGWWVAMLRSQPRWRSPPAPL